MSVTLPLPTLSGDIEDYTLAGAPARSARPAPGAASTTPATTSTARPATTAAPAAAEPVRIVYAAAHVVADPLADNTPGSEARLDWDTTLAFRRHLWSHGLGVADAMDTAQRGMGLTWDTTAELIRRSAAEARACGGRLACGVGTDQLPGGPPAAPPGVAGPAAGTGPGLDAVLGAYLDQLQVVEEAGATPILMASRHLARAATSPDDYVKVYERLIEQASGPVILHWLGPMFDPALTGYWGSTDVDEAMHVVGSLITAHADRVDGIKVSLLEERHEVALRAALPAGVRLYTGDDFNYPQLIKGDGAHFSHALLGIFDAIAPVAAEAIKALGEGREQDYDRLLAPTVPLSRHLFSAPTFYYKTGIVFLAWLTGHQPAFRMVGGLESARSVPHLCEVLRLADRAGLIHDPELAARRMRRFLDVAGVAA